jgi:Na+/H+ antiporter NhaD/arsenite permease-like protein
LLLYAAVAAFPVLSPETALAASEAGHELGNALPVWSVLPFVGMLLSIAVFPLVKPHWWEKRFFVVALCWAALFMAPFGVAFGWSEALFELLEIVLLDYLPFIVLLWGLFAVSGGIVLKGDLPGTPKGNLAFLLIGTIMASWVGTTGASMLLVRPLLRANKWREKKAHTVVFFIFLVSNIGGCLTPVGDPPLFLGFLRGVPFFWTMRLLPLLLFNTVVLLAAYFVMDSRLYKKEIAAGNRTDDGAPKQPLKAEGLHNLVFLAMIVGSVILSGMLSASPVFYDFAAESLKGVHVYEGLVMPFTNLIQMGVIILAGALSVISTKKELHEANFFTWAPIKEVAGLFIGIFITMIPALAILNVKGAELGLVRPWQFFWTTGALSSFLDNAPTYLVFLSTAGSLGATAGVATAIGTVAPNVLLAVSAGAVFMGANTYIGNAPNFMVRSIAEENGVKMPSFFGYMKWSGLVLLPLFVLNTLIFFVR